MFFYTYVLRCKTALKTDIYIGYTNNLRKRLEKHQSHRVPSTKEYLTISLVYYEACRSKEDAVKREKSLKTGFGRSFIKNRIKSDLLRV
ncbi:TPA: excinuclease ABC subunit C [Candidatus Collierbacteria bacterium]|nr:excinuclease ABC subunit C [Candidatus Collierbacteria bacterium]